MIRELSPLLLLLSIPRLAQGQDHYRQQTDSLDTSIETVISGGHWEANGTSGTYRIVVVSEGWEEVRQRVVVQWLVEDQAQRDILIVKSADLASVAESFWSLDEPKLWQRRGAWFLTVRTTAMPMSQPTGTLTVALGGPGRLSRAP
jgi:hypothetical protein